jgi:glycosyltransferase involved in cell wall biosynthesis
VNTAEPPLREGVFVRRQTTPASVSVVMPAKNAARFIAEAIESVLRQGPAVGELIVVDDGSTDTTPAIVRRFDRRLVRLMPNEGVGVSAARNTGARAARGAWLMFLDADDRLRPGAVAALLHAVIVAPEAIVFYGDYDRIDSSGRQVGRRQLLRRSAKPSGQVLERMLARNFIVNGGLMIVRASDFKTVGGFDESLRFCEDWHCWCRLAAIGPFHFIPQFLLDYRVHDSNTMSAAVRRPADFLPAADSVFQDPTIIGRLPPRRLLHLQRAAEAHLITYLATQAIRFRAYRAAFGYALMALWRFPRATPSVILRVASALVGI